MRTPGVCCRQGGRRKFGKIKHDLFTLSAMLGISRGCSLETLQNLSAVIDERHKTKSVYFAASSHKGFYWAIFAGLFSSTSPLRQ